MLTGAIILKQVHSTYMPPLPPLLFAVLHVNRQTRKAALSRAPAYAYIYAWRTPVLDGRPGPFHGAEIAFTFDNAELCDHYSGGSTEAMALSNQISTAWASFARTGDPNHDSLPHWPKYSSEHRATLQFDKPCELCNDPEGLALRLIDEAPYLRAHTAPAPS
jgi:para-nitrobenzyl esterase